MSSKKLSAWKADAEAEINDLQNNVEKLITKKREMLLEKQDVTKINDELRSFTQRINDVQNIVIPELDQQLEKARNREQAEKKRKRIKEIVAEEENILKTAQSKAIEIFECCVNIVKTSDALQHTKSKHEQLMKELRTLGETQPTHFRLPDGVPIPRNLVQNCRTYVQSYKTT